MFTLPTAVTECLTTLRRGGFAAHPVGGCVRDLLLGRVPGDWDITTAARPEQVMALFDKTVPTGLKHGTVTVLLGGHSFEVTTFRADVGYSDSRHPDAVVFGGSLAHDLERRDFTVNAMALGVEGEIIDPFGGQADLAKKLIRAVGDPRTRFREDALRMFRAIRFSAQLGFEVESETFSALLLLADSAKYVSGERVKAEVERPSCPPTRSAPFSFSPPASSAQGPSLGIPPPFFPASPPSRGRAGGPSAQPPALISLPSPPSANSAPPSFTRSGKRSRPWPSKPGS